MTTIGVGVIGTITGTEITGVGVGTIGLGIAGTDLVGAGDGTIGMLVGAGDGIHGTIGMGRVGVAIMVTTNGEAITMEEDAAQLIDQTMVIA